MFLIRNAQLDDASSLLKLARMVHSNNLPDDPELLRAKIIRSRKSFTFVPMERQEREFLFVLEDTDTGNVIGSSAVIPAMGGPGKPHLYFQVRKREFYSEDLQTGQVHVTLQLGQDETGPTEIGGLILAPSYRGHRERLGSQLSLVRFHFIGLNRALFADRVIAEMMGTLTPDSRNTLWDYLGRRFINLSYTEADTFCRQSKEFIVSLFPTEEIYASLLPPEARRLIGRVGPETEPAKILLERMGFRSSGHVDPFDGGPYLEAKIDDLELVRATRKLRLIEASGPFDEQGFISVSENGNFRAMRSSYGLIGDSIAVPAETMTLLGVKPGAMLGVTPRRPSRAAGPELEAMESGAVDVAER